MFCMSWLKQQSENYMFCMSWLKQQQQQQQQTRKLADPKIICHAWQTSFAVHQIERHKHIIAKENHKERDASTNSRKKYIPSKYKCKLVSNSCNGKKKKKKNGKKEKADYIYQQSQPEEKTRLIYFKQ